MREFHNRLNFKFGQASSSIFDRVGSPFIAHIFSYLRNPLFFTELLSIYVLSEKNILWSVKYLFQLLLYIFL